MPRAGGLISGEVRDPAGKPVAGARVYFTGGPGSFPDMAALTDARGKFSLSAPSDGEYRVACAADGFAALERSAKVGGGQAASVAFVLAKD